MNTHSTSPNRPHGPPVEYQAAMADIEKRACRGELNIAQAKQEIFALRERFKAGAGVVAQWAMAAR